MSDHLPFQPVLLGAVSATHQNERFIEFKHTGIYVLIIRSFVHNREQHTGWLVSERLIMTAIRAMRDIQIASSLPSNDANALGNGPFGNRSITRSTNTFNSNGVQ